MLFTSWRDEMSDLLKNYSSYQEHYLRVKNIIDEQMEMYAMCTDDLNEIQNQLNNMDENDDNYDRIAPGTQSIELQDELEGTQDLHPDFSKNYDLSGDLGIPSVVFGQNVPKSKRPCLFLSKRPCPINTFYLISLYPQPFNSQLE